MHVMQPCCLHEQVMLDGSSSPGYKGECFLTTFLILCIISTAESSYIVPNVMVFHVFYFHIRQCRNDVS